MNLCQTLHKKLTDPLCKLDYIIHRFSTFKEMAGKKTIIVNYLEYYTCTNSISACHYIPLYKIWSDSDAFMPGLLPAWWRCNYPFMAKNRFSNTYCISAIVVWSNFEGTKTFLGTDWDISLFLEREIVRSFYI